MPKTSKEILDDTNQPLEEFNAITSNKLTLVFENFTKALQKISQDSDNDTKNKTKPPERSKN